MHRVIAALLATALGAPPDPTTAASPTEPADEAAPEGTPTEDRPREPESLEPDALGLPSVEDPPEDPPPPYTEPGPAPVSEAPRAEGPASAPTALPPAGRDRLGCDFSRSCRQLTVTGTVLGSLGLASIAAGIGLFVRDDVVLPDEPAYATSTKPPGLIALTLGSGVVITSILMLVASHRGGKHQVAGEGATAGFSRRGTRF